MKIDCSCESIGIAGAGRVAQALGRLLREKGMPVVCVASRDGAHTKAAADFIGGGVVPVRYSEMPLRASCFLIAVSDAALTDVARILAEAGARDGVALHTCGTRGPEALDPLRERGVSCATLHPLQTIPNEREGVALLRGIAFAVWGDERAVCWADQIAALLGGEVLRIRPELRPLYHAAAVMASNYVIALMDAAQSIMTAAGVDARQALRALAPLVRASVENALNRGPLESLTGPIERGDSGTVAAHLEALGTTSEHIQSLYRTAGLATLDIARRKGLTADAALSIGEILQEK